MNMAFPFPRSSLPCPALVLDLDRFEANLMRMSALLAGRDFSCRPHAKSHKSSMIAGRQLGAGATGVCCATLPEAEVMINAGIEDVLLTSPFVSSEKLVRALALSAISPRFAVVVDSLDILQQFESHRTARPLPVVIDLDVGQDRTGAKSVAEAIDLAEAVRANPMFHFAGVQAYAGHLQHITDGAEKVARYREAMQPARELVEELERRGFAVDRVTGGGTGTLAIDIEDHLLTETQAGSFIFMDSQYNAVWERSGGAAPFLTSLLIQTEIISERRNRRFVTNAGFKSLATDAGNPVPVRPSSAVATYRFRGDEHGEIQLNDHDTQLRLGDRIELAAPHCDTTVNLHRYYWCVRGDSVVDRWPIMA